jgi:hypothetical protein
MLDVTLPVGLLPWRKAVIVVNRSIPSIGLLG